MDINSDRKDIIKWLTDIFGFEELKENDKEIHFHYDSAEKEHTISLKKGPLQKILNNLQDKNLSSYVGIFDYHEFEVLINEESSLSISRLNHFLRRREEEIELQDDKNGLTYSLSKPSREFQLYLISKLAQNKALNTL